MPRTRQQIGEDWATVAELERIARWGTVGQVTELLDLLESPAAAKRFIEESKSANRTLEHVRKAIIGLTVGATIVGAGQVMYSWIAPLWQ